MPHLLHILVPDKLSKTFHFLWYSIEEAEEGNRLVKRARFTSSTPLKEKKRVNNSHSPPIRRTLFERSELWAKYKQEG